ncbi:MAG: outer membrane beta-barrel family protein [Ferruginibacter sp.]|nr:outer membrane beta-barrel protein [Ferruginibacter sp.]
MKKSYLFFLFVFVSVSVFSQKIIVQDANNLPIAFAQISIKSALNKSVHFEIIADSLGVGIVTLNNDDWYLINISAVNYVAIKDSFLYQNKNVIFTLKLVAKNLNTVNVVSKKKLITLDDEKMVIDAQQYANSAINAFEVVKKTPSVIALENAIYLGATPASIYINGVEQKLSQEDVINLLKNMPASVVSKIEITQITSAKIDASTAGGMINIILKKGVKIGLGGNITIGANQGKYSDKYISGALNKNDNSINRYINVSITNANNFVDDVKIRFQNDSIKTAINTYNKNRGKTYFIGFGIGKEIAKTKNINFDGTISYNPSNTFSDGANEIYLKNVIINTAKSFTNINNDKNNFNSANSFSYKKMLDTIGSEIASNITYNYAFSKNNQAIATTFSLLPIYYQTIDFKKSVHTIMGNLDYTKKLNDLWKIETGIKLSVQYFATKTDYSSNIKNYFSNTENINAVYAQASRKISKMLLKVGLRAENTNMTGYQTQPSDTSFKWNRVDIFPFAYFSYPIMKLMGMPITGNIVAKKFITRPSYTYLNPAIEFINPYLNKYGNPSLKPKFTQKYEANLTAMNFPFLAIGQNVETNIFAEVNKPNIINNAITDKTYGNLSTSKELYIRLFAGVPPGAIKNYYFFIGGMYSNIKINGVYDNAALNFSAKSFKYYTVHEIQATKNTNVELFGYWLVNTQLELAKFKNFGGVFLNISQDILKRKAQVSLYFNDVFYTQGTNYVFAQGAISSSGNNTTDSKRIGFTFKYNFGGKIIKNNAINKVADGILN